METKELFDEAVVDSKAQAELLTPQTTAVVQTRPEESQIGALL